MQGMSQILLQIYDSDSSGKKASRDFEWTLRKQLGGRNRPLVFPNNNIPRLLTITLLPTLCDTPHDQVDTEPDGARPH